MKLNDNHIAYRFLTDDTLAFEAIELMLNDTEGSVRGVLREQFGSNENIIMALEQAGKEKTRSLWDLVNKRNQTAYVITDTVEVLLEHLKVKKDDKGRYDFTVFSHLKPFKKTFILSPTKSWSGGGCLRVMKHDYMIEFCHLCFKHERGDYGTALWTMFYIDTRDNTHAEHCDSKNVQDIYEGVYKMLCFFFLGENDFEIVQPGCSRGTRKSGKVKNEFPVPLTIVNSKWNITTIRTEGFPVSGHFRMQPYKTGPKLIPIAPYMKGGYIRKAKNQTSI